jgi:hypothetical protein
MMKKNVILGLLIIALSILVLVGCAPPKPKPDPIPPPTEPTTQPSSGETLAALDSSHSTKYSVRNGDTLAEIAGREYRNDYFFPLISAANNIQNPDVIEPGKDLKLPDLQYVMSSEDLKKEARGEMRRIADLYSGEGKPNAAARLRREADKL